VVYVCQTMSQDERTRDRGNLFEYEEKQKPSQPNFHGDCSIEGTTYEIRGWHREGRLALTLAPPRGDKNTFPPDVFRGVLDPATTKPARAKTTSKEPAPAWSGDIVSDEAAYTVRAFEKQGKKGLYFTLSFERIEKSTPNVSRWDSSDLAD